MEPIEVKVKSLAEFLGEKLAHVVNLLLLKMQTLANFQKWKLLKTH